MKRILKILAVVAFLLVFGVVGLVVLVFMTEHAPGDTEPAVADCSGEEAALQAGDQFTVLVWNLQYSASRKHQFFYDGGDAVHVPESDVRETLAAIQEVISEVQPDVALIQEIDRDSSRTHRIDQLPALVEAMDARCAATAIYHRSPFVPKPFTKPLGRVQMDLGILSKAGLSKTTRVQLAKLDEARIVQAFNLKRALLHGEVATEGLSWNLAVADTHLSAFSFGDGTLGRQVKALGDWMGSRPEGQPWILAGDFNLLPPGDDPSRLTSERELYADSDNPVEALLPRFQEVADDPLAPEWRTYLPFGASEPDRKIDYVFYGGPLRLVEAEVLRDASHISDHLPIRVVFELVDPDATPPAPVDDAGSQEDAVETAD